MFSYYNQLCDFKKRKKEKNIQTNLQFTVNEIKSTLYRRHVFHFTYLELESRTFHIVRECCFSGFDFVRQPNEIELNQTFFCSMRNFLVSWILSDDRTQYNLIERLIELDVVRKPNVRFDTPGRSQRKIRLLQFTKATFFLPSWHALKGNIHLYYMAELVHDDRKGAF